MRQWPLSKRMRETALAIQLIGLGIRQQPLEIELRSLSRDKLLELYREVSGRSPAKGMLPYVDDWFFKWQPTVHSSLFMRYYSFFEANTNLKGIELLIKAYEMYVEEVSRHRNYDKDRPVLSITRAWMMLRKIKAVHPSLQMTPCRSCGGFFVTSIGTLHYVCGLCEPPARAGKTNRLNGQSL